jgi:hypothetical protein
MVDRTIDPALSKKLPNISVFVIVRSSFELTSATRSINKEANGSIRGAHLKMEK